MHEVCIPYRIPSAREQQGRSKRKKRTRLIVKEEDADARIIPKEEGADARIIANEEGADKNNSERGRGRHKNNSERGRSIHEKYQSSMKCRINYNCLGVLGSVYLTTEHDQKRSKYKGTFDMDCRERRSHALGVYPTQDTSRMGIERVE